MRADALTQAAAEYPALTHGLLRLRRGAQRSRRSAAEKLGVMRYSRPALYGMDTQLHAIMGKRGGYFVEAGANDGYRQSNTYFLERAAGWRGVLVEPIPSLCRLCARERPASQVVNCALVSEPTDQLIEMHYGNLASLVRGSKPNDEQWVTRAPSIAAGWERTYTVEVPARTLTSVLDVVAAPSEPDLLSLDVEGYESEVLRGTDFERYRFAWLLIESTDEDARRAVDALVEPWYAHDRMLSHHDALYRRRA